MAYSDQNFQVGGTYTWTLNAQKTGETWNITGATVTISFRKPNDTVAGTFTATLSNPSGGVATYTNSATLLSVPGTWIRQWKVSVGGVVAWSDEEQFEVGRIAA